jgi:ketosteroid isomerase-like protein
VDPGVEQGIRRAYAAFASGDIEAAMKSFAPDIEMVNPDYAMEGGVRTGLDSMREGLQNLYDQFAYESLEILEIEEGPAGVLVVARLRASGRASGVPIDETFTHVFTLREGRVATYRWFRTRAEGLDAAGLPRSR